MCVTLRVIRRIVAYWPTTRPGCQNRKCTCVNNLDRGQVEWVLNCDVHKKKVCVELLYNTVHRKFNQLETRCDRESQHPAEWALRPPIEQLQLEIRSVGYQTSWREDAGLRNMFQRGWAPRPPGWAAQENRSVSQFVAVLFGLQLPHTHNPFNKELCRSSLLCCVYAFICIDVDVYVLCGYTTYFHERILV